MYYYKLKWGLNGVHVNEFYAPHFVKLIFNLYNSAILPYLLCNVMILGHILHEQEVREGPHELRM